MARLAGYDCELIDPREAFGFAARFPGEVILHDWPDEALASFGLDARTAVVTLTHDPKLDVQATMSALHSDVFYMGCLGSTRTHAKRVARIHGPVGLDIGVRSPAEIAISVMAEVRERRRRGKRISFARKCQGRWRCREHLS